MNNEESRLRTFKKWPADAAVDARRIARAGFYYMGQGLEVQCFSCGARISEWSYGDKVMARHRSLDPGCSFVRNPSLSGNVPMVRENRGQVPNDRSAVGRTPRRSSLMQESASGEGTPDPRYRNFQARLNSFTDWPIPFIVSAEQLALSGFYYTKTADQVQCAFCNVLLRSWEPGDDPDSEHKRHNSICPYMNQRTTDADEGRSSELSDTEDFSSADNTSVTPLKDLGIQCHRVPRHLKYSTYESRLQTYTLWPKSMSQSPEDLADAGFFYTGTRDKVRCFHCDGGFGCWEKSDVPWQEHARYFPYCAFVDLIKGQQFIDEARMPHPPVINEGRETVTKPSTRGLSRVQSVTEEELQELMTTECAVAALQVGIEVSRVKLALRQKVEQTGVPYSSTDALIVAALEIQSEENNSEEINETWTTPPDSPIIGCGRRISRRRNTPPSYDESDRTETLSTRSNEKVVSSSEVVTSSSELPQAADHSDQNAAPTKLSLEEENRRLKEARLCKICMVNEVHVVFLPCSHLLTCAQCARGLINCPVCRQLIKTTVRAFLS